MKIELSKNSSVSASKAYIKGLDDKVWLEIDCDWNGIEIGLTPQQARELATELNKLADEVEEKFYIKLFDSASGAIYVYEKDGILSASYEEYEMQNITWKRQFTQAEIDANPELKKFDSDVFKVRVEDDK